MYSWERIYVGGNKVVHCKPKERPGLSVDTSLTSSGSSPRGVRGGICTTVASDAQATVVHRGRNLLQNGFGNYDVFQNNCEDFALYCKTGLLILLGKSGVGRSGQASSLIGAPLAAFVSSLLKLLIPTPIGVATLTAGMFCMSRYATDIGVGTDVIKVADEDMAVNLGWACGEVAEEESQAQDNRCNCVA
ncbi:hypothetical protein MKX01_003223 [Papaver californicum]|nr:hypothetical protein MKX01_003223 [Papaver californicum]